MSDVDETPRPAEKDAAIAVDESPAPASPGAGPIPIWRPVALGLLLLVLLPYFLSIEGPGMKGQKGIVTYLPPIIGDFVGMPGEISKAEINELPHDTTVLRQIYENGRGTTVQVAIVLAGVDARSIHRPHICLNGQGWRIRADRYRSAPLGNGETMPVRSLYLAREVADPRSPSGKREINAVYIYWYVGKGIVTNNEYERVWANSWQRAFYDTNHRWAYVGFLTYVPRSITGRGPDIDETDEFLRSFAGALAPTFQLDMMTERNARIALQLEKTTRARTIGEEIERLNQLKEQKVVTTASVPATTAEASAATTPETASAQAPTPEAPNPTEPTPSE